MPTSEVIYLGNLRTKAIHLASGNVIITDAPVDNHGKGEYFSPTDIVATAFASCILTIMGLNAKASGYSIDNTRVEVTKIMNNQPRRIAEIKAEFFFPDIAYTKRQKEILKRMVETCPVNLSLHPEIKRSVVFHFIDETIVL